MKFRYEIRLSGDVGQGLILIGKVLAEAAAIYDGYNAVQSQSYGEESRGEANRSEVIISDEDILFPKVERPDLLLCLNQISCEKYLDDLKPNGLLLVDSNRVYEIPRELSNIYRFPIFQTAKEQFGDESLSNIVSLGIVANYLKFLSPRAIHLGLMARIPKNTETHHENALKLGYEIAQEKTEPSMPVD